MTSLDLKDAPDSSTLSNAGALSPTFTLSSTFFLPLSCAAEPLMTRPRAARMKQPATHFASNRMRYPPKRMLELALDTNQTTIIWLIEVGLVTINLGRGNVNLIAELRLQNAELIVFCI